MPLLSGPCAVGTRREAAEARASRRGLSGCWPLAAGTVLTAAALGALGATLFTATLRAVGAALATVLVLVLAWATLRAAGFAAFLGAFADETFLPLFFFATISSLRGLRGA